MTSYPYINNVPVPTNDPSVDAPNMQTNTETIDSWVAVDHVGFNNSNGGKHNQVTFAGKNAQGSQTDPQSVLYTASGTASTVSDLEFKNQNANFPISTLRSLGSFATVNTNGPVSLINGFNVTSITASNSGLIYTIVFPNNVTTGTTFIPFVQSSVPSSIVSYSVSPNTLTIINNSAVVGRLVTFAAFQV